MNKRSNPDPSDPTRQGRMVGLVLLITVILWLAAQWLGGRLGWDVRYVFLFDMAAGAAFLWALFVTVQMWRKRRADY